MQRIPLRSGKGLSKFKYSLKAGTMTYTCCDYTGGQSETCRYFSSGSVNAAGTVGLY
jgi:hypothetical protein